MRIILACTSYWNSQAEFNARYEGRWIQKIDPKTGNTAYQLNPVYNGKFGLKSWYNRMIPLLHPFHVLICCGTWSDPKCNRMGQLVEIVNGGAEPDRPHENNWQYMGCALTAMMAHVCNRRDWDILFLMEPDVLLGDVDWDALLKEFMNRPEEVFGPKWYDRHCDFFGWKPAAAKRYLHSRIRPNLSEDKSLMWLDDELQIMFHGRAWNPWPTCRCRETPNRWAGCSIRAT